MAVFRWRVTSGLFNLASDWANTTLRINPARTTPGINDTAAFATGGGAITGFGSVGDLIVEGGNSLPWLIGAQLQAVTSSIGGPTEVVAGGAWKAGATAIGIATTLTIRDGGLLQASTLVMSAGSALIVLGTGSAVIGSGAGPPGVMTVNATISGAGTITAAGGIADQGTITASGGTLTLNAPISGTGSLQIGTNATLSLTAASASNVTFIGPGGTLEVTSVSSAADPSLSEQGVISGFTAGETILYAGVDAVTSAVATAGGPGLTALRLFSGASFLGSLTLAGSFADFSFKVGPHGAVGTDITLAPRLAPDPVPPPVPVPAPLFDAGYYLAHNPDVAAAGVDPHEHFRASGRHEARNPDAWFDTNFYLQRNPDVAAAGVDPLQHFEAFGWKEGRAPSLLFDDAKYLAANPDVNAAGIDPLVHYVLYGQHEGRATFLGGGTAKADKLIDAAFYDRQLGATLIPTGIEAAQQAAASYGASGWQAGLDPNALFDTKYYLGHNPDVAAAHVNPLEHYESFGWKEGRDPSAAFSTNKYLGAYADVNAAGVDPLLHFMEFGQTEGRIAFTV